MTDAAQPWYGESETVDDARAAPSRSLIESRIWLSGRRADAAAVATLLLLTALISWNLVWKLDSWVARVDIITFYLPWYAHLGEALRNFDVPGWNPYLFSGTPFAGDPQSGWSYLPAMVSFTLFPPFAAMKVFAIMHLLIGGFATYGLGRVLGMGPFAALIAAAAFEFGPFTIHNTTCCTIMAQIAPWVPLAMLGVELGLRATTWVGRGLAWWLTGLAISQMLAGWIGQGAYNGLIAVGSYLAFRTLVSPPNGRPRWLERARTLVAHGIAILGLGFALGAAGALIRLDVNSATNLAGGAYEEVTDRGTEPWGFLTMLSRILSADRSTLKFYLGAATIGLAILAPLVARRRHAAPYFAAYTAVVLILTMKPTPVHELFYLLPQYQSLHEHAAYRIVGLLWIGPAMLAGATVATWTMRAHRPWAIAAAALPLLVVLSVRDALGDDSDVIHDRTVVFAGAVSVLLAIVAVLSQSRVRERLPSGAWLAVALPLLLLPLVFWDPNGQRMLDAMRRPGPSATLEGSMALLAGKADPGGGGEFLQAQASQGEPFRFFGYDPIGLRTAETEGLTYHARRLEHEIQALLVSARPMRLELQDVQGYNPIQLARYVDAIDAINGVKQDYHDANVLQSGVRSPLLDILNARYVVIPNDLPPGRPRPDLSYLLATTREVFRNEQVRVLERTTALPRAWIVHDAIEVEEGEALELLVAGGIDPAETALLEGEPPSLAEPADPANDAATVTHYAADTIRLNARTDADGLLILSEVYDEGWRAYVDGKRVPIYVADHVLRAVPLAAGEHVVELRYEPASLRIGLWITGAALLGGLLLLLLAARRLV